MYYLLAVAALSFLIVVHEGGHYFVARWCKMRIERFSIGFGPGILKRKAKSGTTFQLAPILFGGFVEIRGMNIAEDVDPDDKHAYPNRPAWQRFVTIFAGPATNYVSAVVLAMVLYTCHGMDVPRWYGVDEVMKGYDAQGKLEHGDRILEVDGIPLFTDHGKTLVERVTGAKGAPLTLTIQRNGETRKIAIQPRIDNAEAVPARRNLTEMARLAPALAPTTEQIAGRLPDPVWRIGVKPEQQNLVVSVGVLDAARAALSYPVEKTKVISWQLYEIVFGNERADLGGPTRMVEEFHRAFSAGLVTGITMLMALSVWLGMFNLLPVPALDGGRLVFLGYEMITRRRANPKIEATVHMGGIMVLLVVMILVTLHDFHVL